MDLSTFETATMAEAGIWFTPNDFDGKPLDCRFHVLGQDAKSVRKAMSARASKAIARIQEKKADDEEFDQAEILADSVIGWESVAWQGDELAFSKENVIKVFRAAPFIADQVDRYVSRRRNFIKPVSSN
jgi:hypothetical protein